MTVPATRTRPPATALPRTRRFRIRKGDTRALWASQTVGMLGDEITAVARPTIALLVLHVSAFQFDLIAASSGFFIPVSNTNMVTVRQTLVSPDTRGRVAATVRTAPRTAAPVATILGGTLAQLGTNVLGPRAGLTSTLAAA